MVKRKGKQKRDEAPQEEPESSESDDDDEDDDEEGAQRSGGAEDVLDVDFEFYEPDEEDYHGVKNLLTNGTWEFIEDLNFSELADAVVGQGNIGNLIKTHAGDEENETVCGVLTALNIRQFPKHSWPKDIEKALLAKAKKHGGSEAAHALEDLFAKAAGKDQVGLIFNERMVNLPLELAPGLHKALQEDIEWSCSTPDCPADEKPFYFFNDFVCVSKCFSAHKDAAPASSTQPAPEAPPRKKKRRAAEEASGEAAAEGGGEVAYHLPETAAYVKHASFSFTFPVPTPAKRPVSSETGKTTYQAERRVCFGITRKAFEKAVKDIGRGSDALG